MLRSGLSDLGMTPLRIGALADLILDTIDGLLLDRLVTPGCSRGDAAAAVFADLLAHSDR